MSQGYPGNLYPAKLHGKSQIKNSIPTQYQRRKRNLQLPNTLSQIVFKWSVSTKRALGKAWSLFFLYFFNRFFLAIFLFMFKKNRLVIRKPYQFSLLVNRLGNCKGLAEINRTRELGLLFYTSDAFCFSQFPLPSSLRGPRFIFSMSKL